MYPWLLEMCSQLLVIWDDKFCCVLISRHCMFRYRAVLTFLYEKWNLFHCCRAGHRWTFKCCSHLQQQMSHLDSGATILVATQNQLVQNSTQGSCSWFLCCKPEIEKSLKCWCDEHKQRLFLLYPRWVQWGIFSPIFRPHCGKTGDDVRRIWLFPSVS